MEFYEPRPVIGISAGRESSASLAATIAQIRAFGAVPRVFTAQDYDAGATDKTLAELDALYVLGSEEDIDPKTYGQEPEPHTHVETDTARADFETALIRKALQSKMPLVGIGAGMQRINTLDSSINGGTLKQHVEGHHQGDIAPHEPTQHINVISQRLQHMVGRESAGIYPMHVMPKKELHENSFHHQAVDVVHKDFRVAATADDGTIKAIEPKPDGQYARQFVMGLQWHPEFSASDIGAKLANLAVEEAKLYATAKWREQGAGFADKLTAARQAPSSQVVER